MGWLILALVLAVLLFFGTILWWRVGDQWADDEYKRFGHGGGRTREEPGPGLQSGPQAIPERATSTGPNQQPGPTARGGVGPRVVPTGLYASPTADQMETLPMTTMNAPTAARPLTQRLKDDNWDMHQIAEHGEGTGSVLRGQWSRADYAGMIAQGLLVHEALDEACRAARAARPGLAALLADAHLIGPLFAKDAAYLGVARGEIGPTPGTTRFLAHIKSVAGDPLAVLGLHYVRTGASNGNRFVAQAARRAFGLPETGEGTAHLDPYGEGQRAAWGAYKTALDAAGLSDAEQEAVVRSARRMYEHVISWHAAEHATADELVARHKDRLSKAEFDRAHAVPGGHGPNGPSGHGGHHHAGPRPH